MNPAAPLNGGRGEAALNARFALTETLALKADALASKDRNPDGGSRSAAGTGPQWRATESLTLDASLRSSRETVGSQGLRLGAGWRATERCTLGAQVETELSGDARRRLSLGGDYQLAERTRLYGRWERQSGWVQLAGATDAGTSANALVFGIDSSYLRDTQVFSEYRLCDAISRRDAQIASGIRQSYDLGLAWRPVDHKRFNALAKLEHKLARDASNAALGPMETRAWIAATPAD